MGRKFGSEIGWAILEAISDGVEIIQRGHYQPSALLRYGLDGLRELEAERARLRIRRATYRLKRQRMLKIRMEGKRRALELTRLGDRALRRRNSVVFPKKMSCGRQMIVSFDIPERHRVARHALRTYLRILGFKRVHRSAWFSDYDWSHELAAQMRELGIGKWIVICKGSVCYANA